MARFELLADGKSATNGEILVQALEPDARVFCRRAFGAQPREWVVVELDGVRVYVRDGNVTVSREDVYP